MVNCLTRVEEDRLELFIIIYYYYNIIYYSIIIIHALMFT